MSNTGPPISLASPLVKVLDALPSAFVAYFLSLGQPDAPGRVAYPGTFPESGGIRDQRHRNLTVPLRQAPCGGSLLRTDAHAEIPEMKIAGTLRGPDFDNGRLIS